ECGADVSIAPDGVPVAGVATVAVQRKDERPGAIGRVALGQSQDVPAVILVEHELVLTILETLGCVATGTALRLVARFAASVRVRIEPGFAAARVLRGAPARVGGGGGGRLGLRRAGCVTGRRVAPFGVLGR